MVGRLRRDLREVDGGRGCWVNGVSGPVPCQIRLHQRRQIRVWGRGWGVKVSLHARQWLAGAARYTSGGGEEERERRENCSEEVGLLAAAVVATEHPAARLGSGEAKLGVRA